MSNLLVKEGPCKAYVIARKDLGPFKCRDCGDKSVRFDLYIGAEHGVKAEDVKVCVYCATNKAREDIMRQIIPPMKPSLWDIEFALAPGVSAQVERYRSLERTAKPFVYNETLCVAVAVFVAVADRFLVMHEVVVSL